jgi:hypothetical protein
MQRLSISLLAAMLALTAALADAQEGGLAGLTMRVLDDISDIDAVVLELDGNRGEEQDGADRGERRSSDDEQPAGADSAETSAADAEDDRLDADREDEALHEPEVDERNEGRLEDRDVEIPAAAQPAP